VLGVPTAFDLSGVCLPIAATEKPARRRLESLRIRVSRPDALFRHLLLGLLTGLLAGAVIVAFRLVVEGLLAANPFSSIT
jgi:hypothetical protein